MNGDLINFGENAKTMTSLEIAEVTGKQHKDVMRAIRNMEGAWEKVNGRNFALVDYKDAKGEMRPCYSLTKTECLYVATKFNDEARAKLVIRWEQLENDARVNVTALPNFTNPAEAARAWAQEYEQKCIATDRADKAERKVLQLEVEKTELEAENTSLVVENQELRHDKSYLDLIMRSKALLTVSQIAQDYGMSGRALNNKLRDMGIQYSVNGQWVLYSKYKNCGYVSSRSIEITRSDGRPDIVLHTEWTQAGRKFLYEELKKLGIIPMLER